jgi:hypothetical protein
VTVQEAIVSHLQALLATLPPPNGSTPIVVARSREVSFSRGEGLLVTVRPESGAAERRGRFPAVDSWDFIFKVTVIARGNVPDNVADSTIEAAHALILADTTLGGRCADIVPASVSYDFEVADKIAVAVDLRYRARLLTPSGSLAALA